VSQLKIAREQLKGQLAISVESQQNEMITMGKSLMTFNKVDTIGEIYRKIDQVTAEILLEVANEVFEPGRMSSLLFTR
jgi:predicted Zn-dependent peptidase